MKTNKYPWHAEIVHFHHTLGDGHVWSSDKYIQFCLYLRMFFWKLLFVIPLCVIITGTFSGWCLASLAYMLTTFDFTDNIGGGYSMWLGFNIAVIFSVSAISVLTAGFYLKAKRRIAINKLKSAEGYIKPPQSFIYKLWDTVHNKICTNMEKY